MAIHLAAGSPRRLVPPTRTPGRSGPCGIPIRRCSRWGLPCRPGRPVRGGLLPHRFTLAPGPRTEVLGPAGRSALCGAVPRLSPAGRCPAPLLRGVRTFLDPGSGPRPSGHPRATPSRDAAPAGQRAAGGMRARLARHGPAPGHLEGQARIHRVGGAQGARPVAQPERREPRGGVRLGVVADRREGGAEPGGIGRAPPPRAAPRGPPPPGAASRTTGPDRACGPPRRRSGPAPARAARRGAPSPLRGASPAPSSADRETVTGHR